MTFLILLVKILLVLMIFIWLIKHKELQNISVIVTSKNRDFLGGKIGFGRYIPF